MTTRTPTNPTLTAGIELPYRPFDELREDVEQWAHERGIFEKATQLGQAHKTLEEAVELCDAVRRGDEADTVDALGDVLVTLIIGARMNGGGSMPTSEPSSADLYKQSSSDVRMAHKVVDSALMVADTVTLGSTAWIDNSITLAFERAFLACKHFGYSPCDCLQYAYNEISGRTGRMENGVFVKDQP